MHWIYLLGIVGIVVALAALAGFQPEGGRPAARTRLMTVARVLLVLVLLILLFFTLYTWIGGG